MPLAKGQCLFRQGEPAEAAYIVASGTVAVYKDVDGKRVPIAKMRKGELFGEMAIVDGTERRASAFALEDTTLSLISKEMIEDKMADSDPLVRALARMLINSLRMVQDVYVLRSRHITDTVSVMREQTAAIIGYLESPSVPSALGAEAKPVVTKLNSIVAEMVGLIEQNPMLDRRTPALPLRPELEDAPRA